MVLLEEEGGHHEAKSFTGDAFDLQKSPSDMKGRLKPFRMGGWSGREKERRVRKQKTETVQRLGHADPKEGSWEFWNVLWGV